MSEYYPVTVTLLFEGQRLFRDGRTEAPALGDVVKIGSKRYLVAQRIWMMENNEVIINLSEPA